MLPDRYQELKSLVDRALETYFTEPDGVRHLTEAMRYSLCAGGKRIRAILTLEFAEMCGATPEDALPFACAVEMLHTYSLIHDDLPSMDDDELRRGMPTNHIVYGEACAILAGDALQAAAFRTILTAPAEDAVRAKAAAILAEAAADGGICGGQMLDIDGEGKPLTEAELYRIHSMKTAAMIRAACTIGCTVGRASPAQFEAAERFAQDLGLAFQVRDDVLDAEADTATLGKPAGSDEKNGKTTFATLLGTDAAMRLVYEKTESAKAALKGAFKDSAFLCALADELAGRHN